MGGRCTEVRAVSGNIAGSCPGWSASCKAFMKTDVHLWRQDGPVVGVVHCGIPPLYMNSELLREQRIAVAFSLQLALQCIATPAQLCTPSHLVTNTTTSNGCGMCMLD